MTPVRFIFLRRVRPDLKMKCIFSIDVEDWFHILDIPSSPQLQTWNSLPSRVEKNFTNLLDLFSGTRTRATCFFLGWIAERYPGLVREASARGHGIASHGYGHRLVYEMTEADFFEDASMSKKIIEDVSGKPVIGYRSAGFSTTVSTPWFFDKLIEAGYRYDSSVFPAPRGHGGWRTNHLAPHAINGNGGRIVEFPISIARFMGKSFCFFGGGYLRLFPYFLIKQMTRKVLSEGRPTVFYVHPREIDPDHPRLPMNAVRRFKSYVNLRSTREKIEKLLNDFEFVTFEDYLQDHLQTVDS
jgi:polysaccharide deacetylase family protein (PEP-CTERM system associated)